MCWGNVTVAWELVEVEALQHCRSLQPEDGAGKGVDKSFSSEGPQTSRAASDSSSHSWLEELIRVAVTALSSA